MNPKCIHYNLLVFCSIVFKTTILEGLSMNKIMITLILSCLTLFIKVIQASDITPAPPISKHYDAVEVTNDLFVIHGPLETPNATNQGFMNNPAFLITEPGVVVFDPGSSLQVGQLLLRAIKEQTNKPVVAIFNTHVHGDHWIGNQAFQDVFPEVKIYGHPKMIQQIEAGAGKVWIDLMLKLTNGATEGSKITNANTAANNGDRFKFGSSSVEAIFVDSAHTGTDLMFYLPKQKAVFLGDNAGYGRILRIDGGTITGVIEALNRSLETKATYFIPGHGQTAGAEAAIEYRDYLMLIYAEVKKGYDDDLADFEMKPLILQKMDRWKDWSGLEQELGKHISQAYLEIEAADF